VAALLHSPRLGFHPVAVIDDNAVSAGCIIGIPAANPDRTV
jgi:hypothetical protein